MQTAEYNVSIYAGGTFITLVILYFFFNINKIVNFYLLK